MHAAGDLDMQGNCWNGSGLKMDFKVIKHSVHPPLPPPPDKCEFMVCSFLKTKEEVWLTCSTFASTVETEQDCGSFVRFAVG